MTLRYVEYCQWFKSLFSVVKYGISFSEENFHQPFHLNTTQWACTNSIFAYVPRGKDKGKTQYARSYPLTELSGNCLLILFGSHRNNTKLYAAPFVAIPNAWTSTDAERSTLEASKMDMCLLTRSDTHQDVAYIFLRATPINWYQIQSPGCHLLPLLH